VLWRSRQQPQLRNCTAGRVCADGCRLIQTHNVAVADIDWQLIQCAHVVQYTHGRVCAGHACGMQLAVACFVTVQLVAAQCMA
jgi:hypothetical protein